MKKLILISIFLIISFKINAVEVNFSSFKSLNKILNKLYEGKVFSCRFLDKAYSKGWESFPEGIIKYSNLPDKLKILYLDNYEPDKNIKLLVSKNNKYYGAILKTHVSFGWFGRQKFSLKKKFDNASGVLFKSSEKYFALPVEGNWLPFEEKNFENASDVRYPMYFDGKSFRINPLNSWFTSYYVCEEIKLQKRDKKLLINRFQF